MLSEAEQAQETIETIPCGIRFGMTKDEINSHLEKLSLNPDSTNVSKKDDFYYYTFKFPTGYYKALILPALPMNGKYIMFHLYLEIAWFLCQNQEMKVY